jgi:formate-dependent phosphoribosylglycinamide formyltransferase (GAR transformylase)
MGVALARDKTTDLARQKASRVAQSVQVHLMGL